MRYILAQMGTILALFLIVIPSIYSVNSNLQQEFSIQSMGNILIQDNFAETIFFEYGAESGELKRPLYFGPMGSGNESGSYTRVDEAHVRTGNQAIKFYQLPPTKSDAQRRVELRLYETNKKEFYISWWAYFDNRWLTADSDGWGTTLGGWQTFFGESGNKWHWWTGGRFFVSRTTRNIWFSYGWHFQSIYEDDWSDATQYEEINKTSYTIQDYLNQWVHFQVYIKFATDNTGAVKAWFNDDLVMDKSGFPTNPQGYSAWNQYNCEWAVNDYPWIVLELYQDTGSFESWYWIDDIVAATEEVPDSYGVSNWV